MSIEIRQLTINSLVESNSAKPEEEGLVGGDATDDQAIQELRQDMLDACREMIERTLRGLDER